jgi:hypothetical protein
MKLQEHHLEIIRQVKKDMLRDAEVDNSIAKISFYICSNVYRVALDWADEEYRAVRWADEITDAISKALAGATTMASYIRYNVPGHYVDSATKFSVLARLAWLDKMLESHEIVEEQYRGCHEVE